MTIAPVCLLDRLPIEVISIVCSFLPSRDIAQVRLTCKDCARIGERHLVRDLHLMFHAKSFQNLLHISLHPVLSKHVTSIFYEFRVLEDVDQQEYESNILDNENEDQEIKNYLPDDEESNFRLLKGWEAYKPLLDIQEYMKKTHHDICVLSQAFTRFPVLKTLHISSEFGVHEPASRELCRAFGETLAIPGMMLGGGEVTDADETGIRALNSVLVAASGMPQKLERLNAHRVHWSFFNPSPTGINFYEPVFTYLRYLDLTLESDYDDVAEEEVVTARHVEFGKSLRAATNLKKLRLNFGDNDIAADMVLMQRRMTVPVMWDILVQETTFKSLQSLELHAVTASEECMTDFLKKHKALKVIKWTNMWLTDCEYGWRKIFNQMKRNKKLEVVEFKGCWGSEDEFGDPSIQRMDLTGIEVAKTILNRKRKPVTRLRRATSDSRLSIKHTAFYAPVNPPSFLVDL